MGLSIQLSLHNISAVLTNGPTCLDIPHKFLTITSCIKANMKNLKTGMSPKSTLAVLEFFAI